MTNRSRRRDATRLTRTLMAAMVALLLVGFLRPPGVPAADRSAVPELTAPVDGAVVEGLPLFAWSVLAGQVGATARLEVATDADFAHVIAEVETTDATFQQIKAMDRTNTYWWRVGLVDKKGRTMWSATWAFTLSAPPMVDPTLAPTEVPTETPTEVPTEVPTETPTEVPTEALTTPLPTLTATVRIDASDMEAAPSATPTPKPTRTRTATPTAVQRVQAQQLAIPLSRLTGTLSASPGLPVAGASRSRGAASSNLLVDRDLATIWTSPATTPTEASVTVKLDRSRSIGKIRWMWGLRYHGDRVRIEVSRDQVTWTQVATVANAPTGRWQTLEVNVYTKYIRFRFENPNRDKWIGGLAEVEVYAGKRVMASTPTSTPSPTPNPEQDGSTVRATWYVSPSGSDTNPGTLRQPFKTVQTGLDNLLPGGMLILRGGTYYPPATLTFPRTGSRALPLTVENYPGESPVIDGRGVGSIIMAYQVSSIVLKGLTIQNAGGPLGNGIELYSTTDVKMLGLVVRNAPQAAIYIGDSTSRIEISNCDVSGATTGIDIRGSDVTVDGCQSHDNNRMMNDGADCDGDPASGGEHGGQAFAVVGTSGPVTIRNSRAWNNAALSKCYGRDGAFVELYQAQNVDIHHNQSSGGVVAFEAAGDTRGIRIWQNEISDEGFLTTHQANDMTVTDNTVRNMTLTMTFFQSGFGNGSTAGFVFTDNVIVSAVPFFYVEDQWAPSAIVDRNVYYSATPAPSFGCTSMCYPTLDKWRAGTGQDVTSVFARP